jgi:WD40 repeat protein
MAGLEIIREIAPQEWEINSLITVIDSECEAFNSDGTLIIAGFKGAASVLIDSATGDIVKYFTPNEGYINSVAFSPDGRRVITGANNGTVNIFDIETGRKIIQFVSFTDGEWVAITPDGYYNASAKGEKYLSVRAGENVYGIEDYRSTYNRPDIVQARLLGGD